MLVQVTCIETATGRIVGPYEVELIPSHNGTGAVTAITYVYGAEVAATGRNAHHAIELLLGIDGYKVSTIE